MVENAKIQIRLFERFSNTVYIMSSSQTDKYCLVTLYSKKAFYPLFCSQLDNMMKDYSLSFFSGSSKEIDHGSKMNVGQENSAIMDHHYQHPPQQFPQYYQGKLIFSRGHQS